MGDGGGFDPCEYIWNHEVAMRRLISLLRGSQSYCTDNECFRDDVPRNDGTPDNVLIMSLLMVVAVMYYYFRPNSQRPIDGATKPPGNNDSNGTPPPSSI